MSKVKEITVDFLEELINLNQSCMVTPYNSESDTLEISLNNKADILITAKGIRITGSSIPDNQKVGLKMLKSNSKKARKVFAFDEVKEAARISSLIR